ncbi:MAG TPA: VOC family protein [Pseudonocardia sp.]|jgi:predicted enzyme related to lactoylglutathione lyase
MATLSTFVIDAADPVALAEFYHRLTGWQIADSDPTWATLTGDGPVSLAFQQVPGYRGPSWPDPAKHAHLDLVTDDLSHSTEEVLRLGGSKPDYQPGGQAYTVFADPEGHLFCLAGPSDPT